MKFEEGDLLKAGTTGAVYEVKTIDDGKVYASGPHGPIPAISYEKIVRDIDNGKIEVL